MDRVIVDSGFWIALYEPRDTYHARAQALSEVLELTNNFLPWPSLYEFMNTRFSRRPPIIHSFLTFVKKSNVTLLEEDLYRPDLLEDYLNVAAHQYRSLSLVDLVIRKHLEDPQLTWNAILTFNPGDFQDICQARKIEVLS